MRMIREREGDRGVILIALLWILAVLSIIALSFARETFVEVAASRNSRDLADAYYVARAGISTTIYQILQKKYLPQQSPANQLAVPADPIDLGLVTGQLGDGEYEVEIQDESGKINVNLGGDTTAQQVKALAGVIGIDAADAEVIVDSIVDWVDADKVTRPNGAEDDYYQTLRPPYAARNQFMTTVEELLLVRGITPDYYYGRRDKTPDGEIVERYGLSRYLTVYSLSNRINVNSASIPVLLSVPGMTPGAAQAIYDRRHVKPFETLDEIGKEVGPGLGNALGFLAAQRTNTPIPTVYTLVATAHRAGSKVRRVIRAIVRFEATDPVNRYRIIYWNENILN